MKKFYSTPKASVYVVDTTEFLTDSKVEYGGSNTQSGAPQSAQGKYRGYCFDDDEE